MKISEIQGLSKPKKGSGLKKDKNGKTVAASKIYYYKRFSIEIFSYDDKLEFIIAPIVLMNEMYKSTPTAYLIFSAFDPENYVRNSFYFMYDKITICYDQFDCEICDLTTEKAIVTFAVYIIDLWIKKYLEGNEEHPILLNEMQKKL